MPLRVSVSPKSTQQFGRVIGALGILHEELKVPDTKGFNFTVNIQTIGVFIAALGSIAALISAWYQVAPGNPELQARITHIEEFSSK
ncbi:hypothetical protein BZG05_12605, partial [Salinivibrio kushneri]